MVFKWRTTKLGDVINLKRGYDLPASKRIKGSIPILASSGLTGYHNNLKVKGPGVVTGRSGQIGKVFYTEDDYWPLNTTLYVEDFKNNYPKYIYYLLQTLNLEKLNAGSSVPTLNRNHAHQLEVRLPEYHVQKRIADTLFVFEEKIRVNNTIIKYLEEISRTLFRQWFIEFEFPNAEGNPYKSSGGEMVESELGNVPAEWNTYNVGDFVESISQSINKKEKKSAKFLNTSDILAGEIKEVNFLPTNDMPGQAKKMIKNNDILFSEIRPKNRRYAYVDMENPQDYVVSTKLMVLRVNEELFSSKLFYIWLTLPSTINELNHIAESRSGTFPQITFSIISKLKLALPPKKHFTELEASFIAMFNKIDELRLENKALSKLRDTLLPKLLSGEIEIPDELEV